MVRATTQRLIPWAGSLLVRKLCDTSGVIWTLNICFRSVTWILIKFLFKELLIVPTTWINATRHRCRREDNISVHPVRINFTASSLLLCMMSDSPRRQWHKNFLQITLSRQQENVFRFKLMVMAFIWQRTFFGSCAHKQTNTLRWCKKGISCRCAIIVKEKRYMRSWKLTAARLIVNASGNKKNTVRKVGDAFQAFHINKFSARYLIEFFIFCATHKTQ